MNTLQRLLGFFVALLVIAFAGTAAADSSKTYTLVAGTDSTFPLTIPAGAAGSFTLGVKNNSPVSSSNLNSFKLMPPPGVTITGWSLPSTNTYRTSSITPSSDGKSITVLGISPSVSQSSKFDITLTLAGACAGGGAWTALVSGGSQLQQGGQAFSPNPPTLPSTTVSGGLACTVQFVPGYVPQNALLASGVAYVTSVTNSPTGAGVRARVMLGSAVDTTFNGSITLSASGPSTLAGGVTATAVNGVATFASSPTGPSLSATGSYNLFASAVSTTSAPAAIFVGDGVLNCGDDLGFTNPGNKTVDESGFAEGKRFTLNKDGSACKLVNYTFSNTILIDNTVHLKWDVQAQPNAGFTYTATWLDEAVSSTTGMPAHRTRVAWETDPSTGLPRYVPAIACLSQNPPASLGALTSDIGTEDSIPITWTVTPTTYPFPIVINTERMTVNGPDPMHSGYYLVGRDSDGIPGTLASGHLHGAAVMSTPLPIDPNEHLQDGTTPNPYWKQQVRMCLWEESWQAVGAGKVRFTTSVFDIGDGWMIGN